MNSLELTSEVLKPACARRRTAFAVCFGPPGSEAMCVGRRLRSLIRTNSTAAGPRAPRSRQKLSKMHNFCLLLPPKSACAALEVDKNRGKCPNFVYAATPNNTKKRPDPVAALPIIHHFTLAAILTSVSIFFPFNVYKTLPLFHVSTFSLAVASNCPPPLVLGAGR